MLRRGLILKLFDAAYMPRWNDLPRLTEFSELDKQAHKMIYAFLIGRLGRPEPDWTALVEGGIFELLQRIVLTDIKPAVFYRIMGDPEQRRRLNAFVADQLHAYLSSVGGDFEKRFRDYFSPAGDGRPEKRVLAAAHLLSSRWEYGFIRRLLPPDWSMTEDPAEHFVRRLEQARGLPGLDRIEEAGPRRFADLCGQLRFQIRWAPLHRVPKTSVLGHSYFVAILVYLFSLQIGACARRRYNNFFTGLFHDLPEALTRDIISPIKRSVEGLSEMIKLYEHKQMEEHVYALLPAAVAEELRMFTENEFSDTVCVDGERRAADSDEINRAYNEDRFAARDGSLVKAADGLSAFVESTVAIQNGCLSHEFQKAKLDFRREYETREIGGIRFGEIYSDFD